MQRCLGLGDLNFSGCKIHPFRPLLKPSSEERLTTPVLTPDRFEDPATGADRVEFLVDRLLKSIHADGKCVEATLGDGTAAQGIYDLPAALRANHSNPPLYPIRIGLPAVDDSTQWSRTRHPARGPNTPRRSAPCAQPQQFRAYVARARQAFAP